MNAATHAHFGFDELPNNTIVNYQYSSYVSFSSENYFYPVHTYNYCGQFCTTSTLPNFVTTLPDTSGVINLNFAQPVNNLSFYMVGVDNYGTIGRVDVYQSGNNSPQTVYLNGYYSYYPILVNLSNFSNVTRIRIYNITANVELN